MGKYIFSNKAVDDLSKIWDYTYEVWSESQADKYYKMIIEACQDLSENTEVGKVYNEVSDEILGFWVGKHIIFYREMNPGTIEVVRILHGRMDLKNKMKE